MTAFALPLMAAAIVILITATTYLTFRSHRIEKAQEEARLEQERGHKPARRYRSKPGS